MGKQTKSRKTENFGKGKVTPMQVAFIVDRYLSDNNYHQTRSTFRTEASSLISKSQCQEAPKTLLSLGAMLNEYVCLKEKKVMIDQERARLEHENCRVQTLLQGIQSVMNTYNASGGTPTPMIPSSSTNSIVAAPHSGPFGGLQTGCLPYKTPAVTPASLPSNNKLDSENLPSTGARKRKSSKNVSEVASTAKRACNQMDSRNLSTEGKDFHAISAHVPIGRESSQPPFAIESTGKCVAKSSSSQGSGVAKCLFNQPVLPTPKNSSGPRTPPQAPFSPSDKCASPQAITSPPICTNNCTTQEITPTHCTVISSQRVTVSPSKQGTYYSLERNQIITSSPVKINRKKMNRREHVKGRLNFDGSDVPRSSDIINVEEVSTSEPVKDSDLLDIDWSNLDVLGPEFSFTELLGDLDSSCGGISYSGQPNVGSLTDNVSGSRNESEDCTTGVNQLTSEPTSAEKEDPPKKDLNTKGPGTLTTMTSLTKRIQILSPVKNSRSSSSEKNCP